MQLEWGSRILAAAQQLEAQENLILLIRHSERPSFNNIPFEQWRSVELTKKGIEVARSFGRAISSQTRTLSVRHWGSKRCFMTADAISTGAKEAGSRVSGPTPIDLRSPVLNHEEYSRELKSVHLDAFLKKWLNGPDGVRSMVPPDQYAKEIFYSLIREKKSTPEGVTIVATHDLYIMPLVNHFFHPEKSQVDFLDGLAIKMHHDGVIAAFDGSLRRLSNEELTQ